MARGEIRIHLPERLLGAGADMPPFYTKLMARLRDAGGDVRLVARDFAALARADGAHFDFVHNGGVARAQVLNTGAAYLADFWYCDAKGLYFESSLNDLTFDPASVNPDVSAEFFQRLRGDYVIPRRSRYDQPRALASVGAGHIAIFLQDYSQPLQKARYITAPEMVDAVLAHTGGRAVVIKPHPRNHGEETIEILENLRRAARADVHVSDANIHDILRGAAVCVSISSSAAIEGMLHGVPAVLFGRSDLHHCAATARTAQEWPAACARALAGPWPFAAFLHWFLRRHSIDAKSAFLPKILARMRDQGADLAALGLDLADTA